MATPPPLRDGGDIADDQEEDSGLEAEITAAPLAERQLTRPPTFRPDLRIIGPGAFRPPPLAPARREQTLVDAALLTLDDSLTRAQLDRIGQDLAADPNILSLYEADFTRRAAMTGLAEMEERAALRMIGYVTDEEAITRSALDRYGDTWGSAVSAAQVFNSTTEQKNTWTEVYLESGDRRQQVAEALGAAHLAAQSPAIDEHEMFNMGAWVSEDPRIEAQAVADKALKGLAGAGGQWVQQGNNLAIRFFRDEQSWNVLVRLRPGQMIETHPQAMAAYGLAAQGVEGAIDPTSDTLPGRRVWVGSAFKGFDNAMVWLERRGVHFPAALANALTASIKAQSVSGTGALMRSVVNREGQQQSIYEQAVASAGTRKERYDTALVQIARANTIADDAPMRQRVLTAGVSLDGLLAQEPDLLDPTEDINTLVELAEAERDETSQLTRIFQEDIAEPVLTFLEGWDNAIHFLGISAMQHLTGTPDDWINLVNEIRENGVGVLTDPNRLRTLVPGTVDAGQVAADWQAIQQEGLPRAAAAYFESVQDIGDVSDYFGIDPESGWATWVNLGASIAFDPVTYATLGAGPSWAALRKGLSTPGGVERMLASRPIRSAVRQLVEKRNPRLIAAIADSSMDSATIARLAGISAAEYPTVAAQRAAAKDTLEVLREALTNGTWIPSGPGRVLYRKSILGLGEYSARINRLGGQNSRAARWLTDMLARASRHSYTYVDDRSFLSEFIRMATVRHSDNAQALADDIIRAVDHYDAYRAGDGAATALQGELDQVRNTLGQTLSDTADFRGVYGRVRSSSVKDLDNSIAQLDAEIAAGGDVAVSRDALIAQRDDVLRQVAENESTFQDILLKIRELRKQQRALQSRLERVSTSNLDTGELERFVHQWWDEWGDELGLPTIDGAHHPVYPDLPLRDWSPITGDAGMHQFRQRTRPFGLFGDDPELIRAIGMQPETGVTQMPASPYEVVAWRSTPNQATWDWLHGQSFSARAFKTTMDGIQKIWAASVLLNVGTAVRSNLDEVIRMFEDMGISRDLWGALRLRQPQTPESRAFVRRELDNSFAPARGSEWVAVNPAEKGKWVHAERWVNGTLLEDRQFLAWTRAVQASGGDDTVARALWREWWETTGHKVSRKTVRGGGEITDRVAFDAIDNGLNQWLSGNPRAAQIRDEIIGAGARGEKLPGGVRSSVDNWRKPPERWRDFPHVPGEVPEPGGGALGGGVDKAFHAMYGAPQNRRGGVFYDRNLTWATETLTARFEGRIMNEAWLLDRFPDMPVHKAQEMIAAGSRNPKVRELLAETGMMLEADIHQAAMKWAGQGADDMMYTFGAVSVAGKKVARVYPFGRAQVDYFQWWWGRLTEPTHFTWSAAPVARGPLARGNLRLVDRMAHLAQLREPGERADPLSPAGIVDQFSFLPTSLDNQFLMEITPSYGVLPGWLVNLPNFPPEVREVIQLFHPAHATFTEPYDDYGEAMMGLWDSIVPKRGSSVWATLNAVRQGIVAAAAATIGWDGDSPLTPALEARLNSAVNQLIVDSDFTPYVRDRFAFDVAAWLDENGNTAPSADPASQTMQTWATMLEGATVAGVRDTTGDFFKRMAGVPFHAGSDHQQPETLAKVADYVAAWREAGYISEAKRDSILALLSVINAGTADADQRLAFADDVMETLFELLPDEERVWFFAENPGANVNLISWYRVLPHLVPPGTVGVEGDRIVATGEAERLLREQGQRDGWLVVRDDPTSYASDGHYAYQRSVREHVTDVYEEAINGLDNWTAAVTGADVLAATYADDSLDLMSRNVTLEAEWWERHGDFLQDLNGFSLPDEVLTRLATGEDASMNLGEFRAIIRGVKDRYDYQFTSDQNMKVKLYNLGDDERPMTVLATLVSNLEGFEDVTLDTTKPLSFYGQELFDEIAEGISLAERNLGWSDPSEWPEEGIAWTDTDGNEHVLTREGLRERFRAAVALSRIDNYDGMELTENDYLGSRYASWLGDLSYVQLDPPPFDQVKLRHVTTWENIDIVDGDTITVMDEDGDVTFRLVGLAAAEQTEPGYDEARTGLDDIIRNAKEVGIAIWNPELFGLRQRFFSADTTGAVVHNDRYFAVLYIDGVPLWDATLFSATNPRGVRTGGGVPDYAGMLRRERSGG